MAIAVASGSMIPHPIPYQGSKRRLASSILPFFYEGVCTLVEPFAGSGAISLAAARGGLAERFVLNDSLPGLVMIWQMILHQPGELAEQYAEIWHQQAEDPAGLYGHVRDLFNAQGGAARLLFLLARCVKNAVRFNDAGHFNQAPDQRRRGTHPTRMRQQIMGANRLLGGRCCVVLGDYAEVLLGASVYDLVYLDPPYQGTSNGRDPRYYKPLDRERFIVELEKLRSRAVPHIVSFDGRSGTKTYGPELPAELGLVRLEIHAGRSTQATLNGRETDTFESLYLSPDLAQFHGLGAITRLSMS